MKHKYNRHPNQYSTRDPRGLYLMLGIMAVGGYLWYRFQPLPEPFNPLISHSYGVAKVYASEPILEPFKHSKRAEGCIKNNPDVAGKIRFHFPGEEMALELICRESSFNPKAINPTSGACGLAQALPCSKMKCKLSDVDCQLEWIGNYVDKRYGSFEKAIEFHNINNWY